VVLPLGEPFPGLVRRIEGSCDVEVEVTEVVCPVTMVTEEEEDVVDVDEVLEAG